MGGAKTLCVCKLLSNRQQELLDCEDSCIGPFVGKEMERIALRHLFLGWLVYPEEKRE